MDINELIYTTLTPLDVPLFYEQSDESELLDEFIVYQRITGRGRNFADNKPLYKYHYYRVNCYTKNKLRRQQIIDSINSAMIDANFYPQNDNTPIPREAQAEYWGCFSEFTYWEAVG